MNKEGVRGQIAEVICSRCFERAGCEYRPSGDCIELQEEIALILAIPNLKVVDLEAELPKFSFSEEPPNMRFGWQEAMKSIQEAGWLRGLL